VPDLDDDHRQHVVVDLIDDAIYALADAEALLAGESLATRWARLVAERV
jgi:hypothetical protein